MLQHDDPKIELPESWRNKNLRITTTASSLGASFSSCRGFGHSPELEFAPTAGFDNCMGLLVAVCLQELSGRFGTQELEKPSRDRATSSRRKVLRAPKKLRSPEAPA